MIVLGIDPGYAIVGCGVVEYVNNNNASIKDLEFNLYPNAFRENSKQSVISLSKSSQCYFNGKSYGNIDITKVYSNNDLNKLLIPTLDPKKPKELFQNNQKTNL